MRRRLVPFLVLQDNLSGNVGTTMYLDTNAGGGGPCFCRVGVK